MQLLPPLPQNSAGLFIWKSVHSAFFVSVFTGKFFPHTSWNYLPSSRERELQPRAEEDETRDYGTMKANIKANFKGESKRVQGI